MISTVRAVTNGASRTAVRVQKEIAVRSVGLATTYSIPSRMSVTRVAGGRSIGARRSRRTSPMANADSANDTASMASVGPGPMEAASKPATAGPMMKPIEKMTSKYEFARPI